MLGVKPGMQVADICAGAGGKSLILADIMKNKGRILSLDINQKKLQSKNEEENNNEEEVVSQEESIEDVSSDSIEEDSKDE